MQEMMKAMMQGQGGDAADMEEMQSMSIPLCRPTLVTDGCFLYLQDSWRRWATVSAAWVVSVVWGVACPIWAICSR